MSTRGIPFRKYHQPFLPCSPLCCGLERVLSVLTWVLSSVRTWLCLWPGSQGLGSTRWDSRSSVSTHSTLREYPQYPVLAGFGLYTVGFPLIAITALSYGPRVYSEYRM